MELIDLILVMLAILLSIVGRDERWTIKERVEPP